MKTYSKYLSALFIAAGIILTAAITAFAGQYHVDSPTWEENAGGIPGKTVATWDNDEKCSCEIELYRNNSLVRIVSCGKSSSYDFTRVLANLNKTGSYTFKLKAANEGDVLSGDVYSDEALDVDSAYLKAIETYVNAVAEKEVAKTPIGWSEGPGGWRYCKGSGVFAKNEWITDGGYRYYLGADTIMYTGWRQIKNYWYYFTPNNNLGRPLGSLYVNTYTPDGYYVNGDGIWISNPANNASARQDINSVSISMKGPSPVPGTYYLMNQLSANNVEFTDFASYPDQAHITPGTEVTITATMIPKAGYRISEYLIYACSGAQSISVQGSGEDSRRVVIKYKPKFQLETPTGVLADTNQVLKWTKVNHANAYVVKITDQSGTNAKTTTETNSFDVLGYIDNYQNQKVTVTITATHTGKAKLYLDSAPYVINDLNQFFNTGITDGELKRSGEGMYYLDATGKRVKGWQAIGGSWYHFNSNGIADGPGWYQDTTGFWYYFDASHCMMTGYVNDNGVNYFLNDGTYPGIPVGAWIQGR